MNDSTPIRFSLPERRTERMTGLVTPSTRADWETIQEEQAESPMSVGDLITLAVELIKQHPSIFDEDYELKEKE